MSARWSDIPVSGLVLQKKANDLDRKLDFANFKASANPVVVNTAKSD